MLINVEQNGNEFSVTFQATEIGNDIVYRSFFEDTDECPLPSGILKQYTYIDGTYTINETVEAGLCKTLAIMISENAFWVNRKESLVINLDNR